MLYVSSDFVSFPQEPARRNLDFDFLEPNRLRLSCLCLNSGVESVADNVEAVWPPSLKELSTVGGS